MKNVFFVVMFAATLSLAGIVLAEDKAMGNKMDNSKADQNMAADQMECPVMGKDVMKGDMMGGMMKMHAMHGMMDKSSSIVSSNDGGVIVMRGNKLYKYDKDLNLMKEVDLKMDDKYCPMPGMMHKDGMPMGKDEKAAPKATK